MSEPEGEDAGRVFARAVEGMVREVAKPSTSYEPIPHLAVWLAEERRRLEAAWGPDTRYQRWDYDSCDPSSRGQCGVSSAHLFPRLRAKGLNVAFVTGRAVIAAGTAPILEHCWLEVSAAVVVPGGQDNYIVDLTADQATCTVSPALLITRKDALACAMAYGGPQSVSLGLNVTPTDPDLLARLDALHRRMP